MNKTQCKYNNRTIITDTLLYCCMGNQKKSFFCEIFEVLFGNIKHIS